MKDTIKPYDRKKHIWEKCNKNLSYEDTGYVILLAYISCWIYGTNKCMALSPWKKNKPFLMENMK